MPVSRGRSTTSASRSTRPNEVAAAIARANDEGFDQKIQENVSCCYAVQDKTWIQGPDNAWEFYTVLDDAPSMGCDTVGADRLRRRHGGRLRHHPLLLTDAMRADRRRRATS